jgi:excisionase family DNA binding protein
METLLTIGDVALITKIKVCTRRKHILRRSVPFVKLGAAIRFRPAEIEAWIETAARAGVGT